MDKPAERRFFVTTDFNGQEMNRKEKKKKKKKCEVKKVYFFFFILITFSMAIKYRIITIRSIEHKNGNELG